MDRNEERRWLVNDFIIQNVSMVLTPCIYILFTQNIGLSRVRTELHGTGVEKDRVGEGVHQTVVFVENGNFSEKWVYFRIHLIWVCADDSKTEGQG